MSEQGIPAMCLREVDNHREVRDKEGTPGENERIVTTIEHSFRMELTSDLFGERSGWR